MLGSAKGDHKMAKKVDAEGSKKQPDKRWASRKASSKLPTTVQDRRSAARKTTGRPQAPRDNRR
jgi:hypothetical protein